MHRSCDIVVNMFRNICLLLNCHASIVKIYGLFFLRVRVNIRLKSIEGTFTKLVLPRDIRKQGERNSTTILRYLAPPGLPRLCSSKSCAAMSYHERALPPDRLHCALSDYMSSWDFRPTLLWSVSPASVVNLATIRAQLYLSRDSQQNGTHNRERRMPNKGNKWSLRSVPDSLAVVAVTIHF